MNIASLRKDYHLGRLRSDEMLADPIDQFTRWFQQAQASELLEPNAMVLATVDSQGKPSQRHVLLKHFDSQGFVFFTNRRSRKATDIDGNPEVSLLFGWLGLERQVTVRGAAQPLSRSEVLRYFLSRPRESQLAAHTSPQSQSVSARAVLESRLKALQAEFAGRSIPLPAHWGGYRVIPQQLEFWQGGPSRLHDRFHYQLDGDHWQLQRLAP